MMQWTIETWFVYYAINWLTFAAYITLGGLHYRRAMSFWDMLYFLFITLCGVHHLVHPVVMQILMIHGMHHYHILATVILLGTDAAMAGVSVLTAYWKVREK